MENKSNTTLHFSVFSAEETPYNFFGEFGKLHWQCKYCSKDFTSPGRIYQHCRREVYKENMQGDKVQ